MKKKYVKFFLGPHTLPRRAILHLNRKTRNLYITLVDLKGSVIFSASAGLVNISRRKRVSPQAVEKILKFFRYKTKRLRIKSLIFVSRIKYKSLIMAAVSVLSKYGYAVTELKLPIPIPHNGVRRRKPRRL